MSLEEKVLELGRQVLGADVVVCLDAEHVLDRVAARMASMTAFEAATDDEERIDVIEGILEDVRSDLSSVEWKLDEIRRARKGKAA